jgi:hypothetical protein
MTDGATMPAFSDERLIDAAGAVVADRPEQRPLLVVAVASRLEVVVDAPPTPPTEPSAGVERWIGSIKLYRALAQAPVVMYAGMLQRAHTEADGSAPCKGDHIHDDRCSDRH